MGSHSLRDLFAIETMPRVPSLVQQIKSICDQRDFSLEDFSKVIRYDPGLICEFVRRANAKIGMREVMSVQQAVYVCGRNEALAILQDVQPLDQIPRLYKFHEMFEFAWANCISQAIAAESIKDFGIIDDASTTYLTGMLSDMGVLALMQTYPEEYFEQVWQELVRGKELGELQDLEFKAFGFSHVTVGHELGRRWRLGEAFSSSILHHHQELNGGFYCMTSQAANIVIQLLDCKTAKPEYRGAVDEHLRVCFQLEKPEVDTLLQRVETRRQSILQELNINTRPTLVAN